MFPPGEPVFGIRYSGFGHEAAGRIELTGLGIAFSATTIAAWLLLYSGGRVISRYSRRVLFFAVIGLLFAVFSDLTKCDIGGYPLTSALLLGAFDFISWTLAGLVMAWRIKPEPTL
jgi:Na+/serine symporter